MNLFLLLLCGFVFCRINYGTRSYGFLTINARKYEKGLLKQKSYDGVTIGRVIVMLEPGMKEWTRNHPLFNGASIGVLENQVTEGSGVRVSITRGTGTVIGMTSILARNHLRGNHGGTPYDGAVIGKMIVQLDPGMEEWTRDHPHLRGATIGELVNQYI